MELFREQLIIFTNVLMTNIKVFLKWFECFSILIGCYVIKKISTTKLSRFFGKFVNFNGYNFFTSHGFFADKTEFLSIGLGTP